MGLRRIVTPRRNAGLLTTRTRRAAWVVKAIRLKQELRTIGDKNPTQETHWARTSTGKVPLKS